MGGAISIHWAIPLLLIRPPVRTDLLLKTSSSSFIFQDSFVTFLSLFLYFFPSSFLQIRQKTGDNLPFERDERRHQTQRRQLQHRPPPCPSIPGLKRSAHLVNRTTFSLSFSLPRVWSELNNGKVRRSYCIQAVALQERERERNAKYFPVCVYSNHLCQCVLRLKNTQTFVCTRAKKTKQSLSLAVKQCQSGSERENQKRIQSI